MSGTLDLCVLRNGNWEIYNVYDASEEDEAVRDAIDLKNNFKAVVVMNPARMSIIYSYDATSKDKPNFRAIRKDLETDKKPSRTVAPGGGAARARVPGGAPRLKKRPETVDQSAPNPVVVFFRQIIAALAGLFGMKMADEHSSNTDQNRRRATANTGPLPPRQDSSGVAEDNDNTDNDADPHEQMEASLSALDDMLAMARNKFWSDKEGQMKGDAHFGIMLYLAGAARKFAHKRRLPAEPMLAHLADGMGDVGMQTDLARKSFDNIDEFLLKPRNHRMFQRGAVAAKQLLRDPGTSPDVTEALEAWLNPEQGAEEDKQDPAFLAVLFTDIVNFTASVEDKGHDWMKDVLRAHNDIVRSVLGSYQGKEVKHTGDGIMASFTNTDAALRAAVAMQNGFVYFAHKMPQRAFNVRIGISAGEPVAMDGDLFGGPVNMAARVMPLADKQEVTVSANVRGMFDGTEFSFQEIADCELKGFENQSVFKLLWREHKDSANAVPSNEDTPAETPAAQETPAKD